MNRLFSRTLLGAIALAAFAASGLHADPPDTLWAKAYGEWLNDYGYAVRQTPDAGFIIAGISNSRAPAFYDAYLTKVDSIGNLDWRRHYGGDSSERAYWVELAPDNGYLVCGSAESYGAGALDVYFLRLDSIGDTLWTRAFGGTDKDEGKSFAVTTDGNYVIAGYTKSFGAGDKDFWFIKLTPDGDTVWARTYGGTQEDMAWGMSATSDNGCIATGWTKSHGAGSYDVWLVRIDSTGDTLWTQTFGGSSWDSGSRVYQTADGGYIVGGYTMSYGAGQSDFWLIKTDSLGNSTWSKTYGGSNYDNGIALRILPDGGYLFGGTTQSYGGSDHDFWLVRTDADGDTLWTREYGGDEVEEGKGLCLTTDGGYAFTGSTRSFSSGSGDIWLLRFPPDPTGIAGPNPIRTPGLICRTAPNPFSGHVSISYQLPQSSPVRVTVCDALGTQVRTLANGNQATGTHVLTWDGRNDRNEKLPAGVYFLRVSAGGQKQTARLVLTE